MAERTIINWPAANPSLIASSQSVTVQSVASSQNTTGAAALVLNNLNSNGYVLLGGNGLPLYFSSSSNLSAVTITIIGESPQGFTLNEQLAGPNANTVISANLNYKTISAILVGGAVTGLSVAAGGVIVLNFTGNSTTVTLPTIQRLLTITSTSGDLSATKFTFQGVDSQGNVVTDTISGPAALGASVTTSNKYNIVNNMWTSNSVSSFSVGTGISGSTSWVQFNRQNVDFQAFYQVGVASAITYQLDYTMDSPYILSGPLSSPNANMTIFSTSTSSANVLAAIPIGAYTVRLTITTATGGSLVFETLQQGIK